MEVLLSITHFQQIKRKILKYIHKILKGQAFSLPQTQCIYVFLLENFILAQNYYLPNHLCFPNNQALQSYYLQ
jgi:hypothetical protein